MYSIKLVSGIQHEDSGLIEWIGCGYNASVWQVTETVKTTKEIQILRDGGVTKP